MDKRIIRTRLAVLNALLELAAEKDIDKITVVELCERAGINKSTFYLHYSSRNDCIKKCFDIFVNKITEFGKDIDYTTMSVHPEETIKKILDVAEDNLTYVEKFRNTVIYDQAIKTLKEKLVEEIMKSNNLNINDNYHEVAKIKFLVGGCADIIVSLSPNFQRDEIESIIVNCIKRK